MTERPRDAKARRPLRDVVSDIDRDILKLLVRRHNLLSRMSNTKGFLEAAEEKTLREAWEAAVSRVSRDARLSGHFFSLLQEMEFLPRPAGPRLDEDGAPEEGDVSQERRPAFNLAPPPRPVRLNLPAPLACRASRAWLLLAAASGQALHLGPCLMNDPLVDCVKMLNQLGASLTREDDGVTARPGPPLAAPDRVVHVGDSAWNLYLMLAWYVGRPSRAKLTGETDLKLADLSAVRRFLPSLGARLVHVVPKSDGLPARLECSGLLPDVLSLPADVPAELGETLLLAAPFYEKGLSLDLSAHPAAKGIMARALPLLHAAGAEVSEDKVCVRVNPATLRLPAQPALPLEAELAVFLLALPAALGGESHLSGQWPTGDEAEASWQVLHATDLDLRREAHKDGGHISATAAAPLKRYVPGQLPPAFPARLTPLPVALAACAALRNGEAVLPPLPQGADKAEVGSFLHTMGLEQDEGGRLSKNAQVASSQDAPPPAWNAPSPAWALALALAACARPHRKLGNPGIMTGLYPAFWALYNALPEPAARRAASETAPLAPAARRRIITQVAAVPPELKDEE